MKTKADPAAAWVSVTGADQLGDIDPLFDPGGALDQHPHRGSFDGKVTIHVLDARNYPVDTSVRGSEAGVDVLTHKVDTSVRGVEAGGLGLDVATDAPGQGVLKPQDRHNQARHHGHAHQIHISETIPTRRWSQIQPGPVDRKLNTRPVNRLPSPVGFHFSGGA